MDEAPIIDAKYPVLFLKRKEATGFIPWMMPQKIVLSGLVDDFKKDIQEEICASKRFCLNCFLCSTGYCH